MAFIELHDSLREHRKSYMLAAELKIEKAHAIGLLACLWMWASQNAEDGDLTAFPVPAIEAAAG